MKKITFRQLPQTGCPGGKNLVVLSSERRQLSYLLPHGKTD